MLMRSRPQVTVYFLYSLIFFTNKFSYMPVICQPLLWAQSEGYIIHPVCFQNRKWDTYTNMWEAEPWEGSWSGQTVPCVQIRCISKGSFQTLGIWIHFPVQTFFSCIDAFFLADSKCLLNAYHGKNWKYQEEWKLCIPFKSGSHLYLTKQHNEMLGLALCVGSGNGRAPGSALMDEWLIHLTSSSFSSPSLSHPSFHFFHLAVMLGARRKATSLN